MRSGGSGDERERLGGELGSGESARHFLFFSDREEEMRENGKGKKGGRNIYI